MVGALRHMSNALLGVAGAQAEAHASLLASRSQKVDRMTSLRAMLRLTFTLLLSTAAADCEACSTRKGKTRFCFWAFLLPSLAAVVLRRALKKVSEQTLCTIPMPKQIRSLSILSALVPTTPYDSMSEVEVQSSK